MSPLERRSLRNGLLCVSPWVIGVVAFTAIPMVMSLYYSFTNYNGLSSTWAGFSNYVQLFTSDPEIPTAIYNTLYLTVFGVIIGTGVALTLALMLNAKVHGRGAYRTIYYLPTMLPIVVTALAFSVVFSPSGGALNAILSVVGIQGPGWLDSVAWAKPALVILSLWGVGNAMVIYLAGLQDVPAQLLEAAAVDGAGWFRQLRHVILPMISPVIFFNVLLGLIASFQNFTTIYYLTSGSATGVGGPANATMTWGLALYEDAFVNSRFGYASAMAWVMFLVVLLMTIGLFRVSRRWVYYAS